MVRAMIKKTRFSVSYFISVLMIFLAIQWLFFPPTRNIREITYNSFKAKIDSGKVSKVLILPDRIVGELKDATGSDKSHSLTIGPSSPLRVRIKQIEAQMARQFYVNRLPVMEDPDLLKKLEHANV